MLAGRLGVVIDAPLSVHEAGFSFAPHALDRPTSREEKRCRSTPALVEMSGGGEVKIGGESAPSEDIRDQLLLLSAKAAALLATKTVRIEQICRYRRGQAGDTRTRPPR